MEYKTVYRGWTENGVTTEAKTKQTVRRRFLRIGIETNYQIHELEISEDFKIVKLKHIYIY